MTRGIYIRTKEHNKKIGEANKGKKRSQATKEKMSLDRKGRIVSDETRMKLSEVKKGKNPHKWSKESLEKLSNTLKGRKASNDTRLKMSNSHKGEKHWQWKGGISLTGRIGYNSYEYSFWRRKVFERDNFTCQECGYKGNSLSAHHIKSWSQYPELKYDINNGITLCNECHKLTDNYKGRSNKAHRQSHN